jgi:hypothetical protein
MTTRTWLIAASLAVLAPLSASCLERECGEGTIESNGVCVPADGIPETGACAAGTHYDTSVMACVSDTICDPETTIIEFDEEGNPICKGVGGSGNCDEPIQCPQPQSGRMTVCGRLFDIATNQEIRGDNTTARCELDGSGEGACKVELKYYDALAFANNPNGTPELGTDDDADDGTGDDVTYIDNCGRFKAHNVVPPQLGFLAVGSDDHDRSSDDIYVRGGVALPAAANVRDPDVKLYVTTRETDMAWSSDVDLGGQTFSEVGVYLPIFLHGDIRVPGVKITNSGAVEAGKDYYFDDATADTITSVNPALDETGMNGAGLMVDVALSPKSGQGGEPAGCTWPEDLGVAIPGVVFIQERHAICE